MGKIDLHLHTTFSDGLLSPDAVLEFVHKHNYTTISITDHDNLDGYKTALPLSKELGITLIPGVEISTIYKNADIHILAYYVDPDNKELNDMLLFIHHGRYYRAKKIVDKLREMSIRLDIDKIAHNSGENDYIGRPHIARAMVEAGYVEKVRDAFDIYIGNEGPAFIPKPTLHTADVILAIKKAGGIPVLAHPYKIDNKSILYDIINMGLEGLEVYYARHSLEQVHFYNEVALKNNLARTGGSDFHGEDYIIAEYGYYSAPESSVEELLNKKEVIHANYCI